MLRSFCVALSLSALCVCFEVRAQETATQTGDSKTGSISGMIVNDRGQPMVGAKVYLRTAGNVVSRTTTTNLDGKFEFTRLDHALYYVSAGAPAHVTPPIDPDTPNPTYRVGDAVRLELVRGGVITGTVTNTTGEPVIGVRVRAFMVRNASGKPTPAPVSSYRERATDDRGIYRIYGLSPGTYVIQAGGGGWSQTNATDLDAPTYAPSSTRNTAQEIELHAGDETTIDIRYRGEAGHSISGVVKSQNITGASISVSQAGDGLIPTGLAFFRPNSNRFVVSGLADGDYEVTAQQSLSPTGPQELAVSDPVRVTIKGADVTDLELVPKPLASISGRFNLEKSTLRECQNKRQPLFDETMVWLIKNVKDSAKTQVNRRTLAGSAIPDKDGNFVIRNVRVGQYALRPQYYARYWYVRTITLGSSPSSSSAKQAAIPIKDFTRTWATLKSGERLNDLTITLSEGAGSLRGQLTKSDDNAILTDLRIYLVPTERDKVDDPLRYFAADLDKDKTFAFGNLPPGRYLIVAQVPPDDTAASTEILRLPSAAEARTKLRRAAETFKSEVELKPCQNITDYSLRMNQ